MAPNLLRLATAVSLLMGLATGGARAVEAVTQAAVTVSHYSGVSATMTATSSAEPFLKNGNDLLIKLGTSFHVTLTYSPVPADWPADSSIAIHHIGITGGSGDLDLGDSGDFTFAGSDHQYLWLQIKYIKNTPSPEEIYLNGSFKLDKPGLLARVRSSYGPTLNTHWSLLALHMPDPNTFSGNFYDHVFDVYVICPDPDSVAGQVPCRGVEVQMFYTGAYGLGVGQDSEWRATGQDGHATVTVGAGGTTDGVWTDYLAQDLCFSGERAGYAKKILGLPGYCNETGMATVTVKDVDERPIPNVKVYMWGGPFRFINSDQRWHLTDAQGKTTFDLSQSLGQPRGAGGLRGPSMDLQMHLPPTVQMFTCRTQYLATQTNNSSSVSIVPGIKMYVSPEIWVSPDAITYTTKREKLKGATFRLYDEADLKTSLAEISNHLVVPHVTPRNKQEYQEYNDGIYHVFFPVTPDDSDRTYRVVATYPDKDQGSRKKETELGFSAGYKAKITRRPKKDRLHIEWVICRVGAWAAVGSQNKQMTFAPAAFIQTQSNYIKSFMPVPVSFSTNPSWAPAKGAESIFSFSSSHLNALTRALSEYQAQSTDIDIAIGIVPPGYLHTHTLFGSGGAAGLSFNGVPGAVLLDPTRCVDHHSLHEILHTLGLPDADEYYDPAFWRYVAPPSDKGYDERFQKPVINTVGLADTYPQNQKIMYDGANSPFLCWKEYNAILDYTMKPLGATAPSPSKQQDGLASAPAKVMTISGSFRGDQYPPITLEPILVDYGEVYNPSAPVPVGKTGCYLYFLDATSNTLEYVTFKSDEPTTDAGNPWGYVWAPDENPYPPNPNSIVSFFCRLPWHDDLKFILIGSISKAGSAMLWKTIRVSDHAPTASWLAPAAGAISGEVELSWQASDADAGDALSSMLQISPDGGANWRTLASNLVPDGAGVFRNTIFCDDFATSPSYRFRALVSDGVHTAILEAPGAYQITGSTVEELPVPRLLRASFATTATAPAVFQIPIPIANAGNALLLIGLDRATTPPAWLSCAATTPTLTILPDETAMMPVVFSATTSGTYTTTLTLTSNCLTTPSLPFPIQVIVCATTQTPVVDWIATRPQLREDQPVIPGTAISFRAFERSGQTGLETTITIRRLVPLETVVEAPMFAAPEAGQYVYDWYPSSNTAAGVYVAEVDMASTATGLADLDGWKDGGWDLSFEARSVNRLPVFTAPARDFNDVYIYRGDEAVMPYQVSDPDGGHVELSLHGLPYPVFWDQTAGVIRWIPTATGDYRLTLFALDDEGGASGVQWRILSMDPPVVERAYPGGPPDNTVLTTASVRLVADCFKAGQQGCRFEWRLAGTPGWTLIGFAPYQPYEGHWRATIDWDISGLPAGASVEVRFVNVNALGQLDGSPRFCRYVKAGAGGGGVIEIACPRNVVAGRPFTIYIVASNSSTETWTDVSGVTTRPVGADPFTSVTQVSLSAWTQIPPSGTGAFAVSAVAPLAPGDYTTHWRLYADSQGGFFGSPGEATVKVYPASITLPAGVLETLLGKRAANGGWLNQADLNGDGVFDVADLVIYVQLMESLSGH